MLCANREYHQLYTFGETNKTHIDRVMGVPDYTGDLPGIDKLVLMICMARRLPTMDPDAARLCEAKISDHSTAQHSKA